MKINFIPYQAHSLEFGGFEHQMLDLFNALKENNYDVIKFNPYDRDDSYDIMHFWGLEFEHLINMRYGKIKKKKIVLTALLSYNNSFLSKIRTMMSIYFRKMHYLKMILDFVDIVVVVNELQAKFAKDVLRLPAEKIKIIPNMISDDFFQINGIKDEGYLLTTGNVSERKNQLMLAKICLKNKIPLKIVGGISTGSEKYAQELKKLIANSDKIEWINELKKDSSELQRLYQNCSGFVLLSKNETQPISVLEATAMGKPVLLSDFGYSKQPIYRFAMKTSISNYGILSNNVINFYQGKDNYLPDCNVVEPCKKENVVKDYVQVYSDLLD